MLTFSCVGNKPADVTDRFDEDIVLINIEKGDRAFIGQLLLTIDSCKPILIGIDAWFVSEKDSYQDSVLVNALEVVNNDILGYSVDSTGLLLKSHTKFREHVRDEGLAVVQNVDGLSSHITPITIIDNEKHALFPLKIIWLWKPDFAGRFEPGTSIPIQFRRNLNHFAHFNGSDLTVQKNYKDLNKKVVLLGYLGPLNEDKHFTPMRYQDDLPDNQPDTYGLVIIANEIRTILEYED